MATTVSTLADYTPEAMRGWFVRQGAQEAEEAAEAGDSANRENWTLSDQNGNVIDNLIAYNEHNSKSIFDQINDAASKAGYMKGNDYLAYQERDSILSSRRNGGDIAVTNGIRERGNPEEWTHLAINIPEGLNVEQAALFRQSVINGLNQPEITCDVVQTKKGHIALLASHVHDSQGHDKHIHLFVHCHAYDANEKEISKKIDWSKADVRRQAVAAINRELLKAGLIQELNTKGFSFDPCAVIDFTTPDGNGLQGSKAKEKELLQDAGVIPQTPARTVTGQPTAPAAPVITDPEAAKIRHGIEGLEKRMAGLIAQFEMDKQLHESLKHGADAAEQLTSARIAEKEAKQARLETENKLNSVITEFELSQNIIKDNTAKLAAEFHADDLQQMQDAGIELSLPVMVEHFIESANQVKGDLESEEQSHLVTQTQKAEAETKLAETTEELNAVKENLSAELQTHGQTKEALAAAEGNLTQKQSELETTLSKLEKKTEEAADLTEALSDECKSHDETRDKLTKLEILVVEQKAERKAEVAGLNAMIQSLQSMQQQMQDQFSKALTTLEVTKQEALASAAQAKRDAEIARQETKQCAVKLEAAAIMESEVSKLSGYLVEPGEDWKDGFNRFKVYVETNLKSIKEWFGAPVSDGKSESDIQKAFWDGPDVPTGKPEPKKVKQTTGAGFDALTNKLKKDNMQNIVEQVGKASNLTEAFELAWKITNQDKEKTMEAVVRVDKLASGLAEIMVKVCKVSIDDAQQLKTNAIAKVFPNGTNPDEDKPR